MASEYWIVVDKDDEPVLCIDTTFSGAELERKYHDEDFGCDAPHRVVHLVEADELQRLRDGLEEALARAVEAGSLSVGAECPTMKRRPNIDPKVAAVVRAAAEEADKMHHCDCATCSAVRDLKLNQLRACGVDNDKETEDD